MAPKIGLGGCLGASWAAPGASWVALGAILAPRGPQEPKIAPKPGSRYHPGPPKLDPKIDKNRSWGLPRASIFLIVCWMVFWCHLVPTWLQLGAQNPPKIDPSWDQVGPKLAISRIKLPLIWNLANITKTLKNQWFFNDFGGFWPSRWPYLAPKSHPKSILT